MSGHFYDSMTGETWHEADKSINFPAIFTTEPDGYSVSFVDLEGCNTQGDDMDEAIEMATEALDLYLEDEPVIPTPTPINEVQCDDPNGMIILIPYFPS